MVAPNCVLIDESDKFLLFKDCGPWDTFPTVTNAAEVLIEILVKIGALNSRRVFYFDSEGDLGEILIKDNKFAGFGFGDDYYKLRDE